MARLQDELLELVLRRLTKPRDVVRCSAVSKGWADVSKHIKPTFLEIAQRRRDVLDTSAQGQLRWLQGLQAEDRLKGLQEAHLHVFNLEPLQPSLLSQGFLVLAGTWQLQKVTLHGAICFRTAVALLPASLLALDLWPDTGPATTRLSAFQ